MYYGKLPLKIIPEKNPKPRCYIAHNIEIRDFIAEKIIPKLEKHFEVVNPFSEKRLKLFKGLTWDEIEDLVVDDKKEARFVVSHDLKKLATCDILFAYIIKIPF